MPANNYIHLKGPFYFDAENRDILKYEGGKYSFVRHDLRSMRMPVSKDRRQITDAPPVQLQPIGRDLYWDAESKAVYRLANNNFVLYSRDRRKGKAKGSSSPERRGK
jgi:hypothetical protein